ncbi:MAG: YbgF trimerization domain-containing protein [Polymorphobacter sp.]
MRSPVAMLCLLLLAPNPLAAQDLDPVRVEKRVGKLESEMRAVQRKVFPGGDPKFFEPEITAPVAAAPVPVGNPASSPLADLSERVGQLETQLRTLTGQVEANQFKVRQLEEAQVKLRGDVEFRLTALEGGGGAVPAAAGAAVLAAPPKAGAKPDPKAPKTDLAAKPPAKPAATPDAAWKAAYAKALAKDWPATETAMTDFVAGYPKSPRVPQAQYWLGRSFAAREQHAQAAKSYLELYQTAPRSDRAPDSLIGLAGAMNGLKKPKDACRVLGELDSVYGEKLTPAQQSEAKTLRTKAKCPA